MPVLSCQTLVEPSNIQLGLAFPTLLSPELFVLLDEMNVFVGLVGIPSGRTWFNIAGNIADNIAGNIVE